MPKIKDRVTKVLAEIVALFFVAILGVLGYLYAQTAKSPDRQEVRTIIEEKVTPVEEDVAELKQDMKDIKDIQRKTEFNVLKILYKMDAQDIVLPDSVLNKRNGNS